MTFVYIFFYKVGDMQVAYPSCATNVMYGILELRITLRNTMIEFVSATSTEINESFILPSLPNKLQIFVNNNPMFASTLA
jgi:hypothetical protein